MKLSMCRTLSAGIRACGAAPVFSVGLAGRQGAGHYIGLPKHWAVLARANAIALTRAERVGRSLEGVPSFDGIRLHDLRHSFASFTVQSGGSLYLVGKALGHKQSRTTEIYAHASDEPLLATAKLAARRIARALDGVGKADRRVVRRQQRNRRG
jgi:integrase